MKRRLWDMFLQICKMLLNSPNMGQILGFYMSWVELHVVSVLEPQSMKYRIMPSPVRKRLLRANRKYATSRTLAGKGVTIFPYCSGVSFEMAEVSGSRKLAIDIYWWRGRKATQTGLKTPCIRGWIGPGALCEHLLVNKGKQLNQPFFLCVCVTSIARSPSRWGSILRINFNS